MERFRDKPIGRVTKVDIVKDLSLRISIEMADGFDKLLFMPDTEYQRMNRTWRQKLHEWYWEKRNRLSTAIEVLQGKHSCGDDY